MTLKLSSFNVEGIVYNTYYALESLKESNIICLQEHWLFSCHKYRLQEIFPNMHNSAKSVDESNHIQAWRVPRGYGGVATLWSNNIHAWVREHREMGNERTVVITLEPIKTCIINIYFPSGNTWCKKDEYAELLAVLEQIVCHFKDSHKVLIVGDVNMDLLKRDYWRDKRRVGLLSFIKRQELTVLSDFTKPTMYAHGDRSTSHIDLVIASDMSLTTTPAVQVEEKVPWNSSVHVPIHIHLATKLSHPPRRPAPKVKLKAYPDVKWNTLDRDKYNTIVANNMEKFQLSLMSPSAASELILLSLHHAAIQSADIKKPVSKPRKKSFMPEVLRAIIKSRQVNRLWNDAGCPGKNHPLSIKRRKTSKSSRAAQRRQESMSRDRKDRDIMEAAPKNQNLMHRIIKSHTRTSNLPKSIMCNGELITDGQTAADAWADYHEDLATPKLRPEWDEDFLARAKSEVASIKVAAEVLSIPITITPDDVRAAVGALNMGKAADPSGIRAEHFAAAREVLAPHLATVLTGIANTEVPAHLKNGRKISIPKKGKSDLYMPNHRGLCITATLGKLLEHVIIIKNPPLHQSDLQFGFTHGCSPVMASLCLTEAIAVAVKEKKELIIAAMDVQKAFDTVNHDILLQSLHQYGMPLEWWSVIQSLYSQATEYVEWEGCHSRQYTIGQGVRQGGVLSTHLFKCSNNDLLDKLERYGEGAYIGDIFVGCPCCADDLLVCANSDSHLQAMVSTTEEFSNTRRYTLHPEKSEISSRSGQAYDIKLYGSSMPHKESVKHLGLQRHLTSNEEIITMKVALGRSTLYSLIPAGLHGATGLSPPASRKLLMLYVLPRMLYGLESLVLTEAQLKMLDQSYLKMLRDGMSLRLGTATEAIYLLMGLYPFRIELHIKVFMLYGAITRLPNDHTLRRLAWRQMTVGSTTKKSWFTYVRKIAALYQLEEIVIKAVVCPWEKRDWKLLISRSVRRQSFFNIIRGAMSKSSLNFMDLTLLNPSTPHHLWPTGGCSARSRLAASVRAKLLAGSYILQYNMARFNQHKVTPTCQLCKSDVEDIPHFLLSCSALESKRKPLLEKITTLIGANKFSTPIQPHHTCFLILNAGTLTHTVQKSDNVNAHVLKHTSIHRLRELVNILCLTLHNSRNFHLAQQEASTAPRKKGSKRRK